ncbi:alpha/beta fold hydrolase [uncultured Sphingomonas sp.]|uniref:alpha/beta fold hydrolase n=1 Tax=uncultured Sphingomonas sp. TaxID=158754 RepID=UPI0035CC3566
MKLRSVTIALGLIATFPFAASSAGIAGAGRAFDHVVALKDGRNIALRCGGKGHFTVLLETGDGGRRAHMAKLFAALAERYRVCDYDRRNMGRSSAAPLPREAADLAADLSDALSAAHVRGPYILFGTSMGGLLVRSYAAMHPVAGFVTSNQPGTSGEWGRHAHPLETPAQRAQDDAWASGDNNEHIDVNDVSRTIDAAGPPTVPHIVMISSERYQCAAAGTCGPTYRAFVAASREAALGGTEGRFRTIDGNHDLYVTNLQDVVRAIDQVAAAASTGQRKSALRP